LFIFYVLIDFVFMNFVFFFLFSFFFFNILLLLPSDQVFRKQFLQHNLPYVEHEVFICNEKQTTSSVIL